MDDLMLKLQEEICLGVLSFRGIAEKYQVSVYVVSLAWDELCRQEEFNN